MTRPAEFAEKATVTDEEAREYERKDHTQRTEAELKDSPPPIQALAREAKALGARESEFWEEGLQLARVDGVKRTSLIIDPPNGKTPATTPEGNKRRAESAGRVNRYDRAQERSMAERCILGIGVPMAPIGYNDNFQIVQTPDHFMIVYEMIHEVRIVRIAATHLAPGVRKWLGDSIGHWEGDTLVVDTTNFLDLSPNAISEKRHVVERFSRADANTLRYKATVDDPAIYTQPWTIEFPGAATSDRIFEFACHEGNYALPAILRGARRSEALAGAK
jgi:hypothetical protein